MFYASAKRCLCASVYGFFFTLFAISQNELNRNNTYAHMRSDQFKCKHNMNIGVACAMHSCMQLR